MAPSKTTTKEKIEIVLLLCQIGVLITRWLSKKKKKHKGKE